MEKQTAQLAGEPTYFTGRPCKHGHIAERNTKDGTCLVCRPKYAKVYRKKRRQDPLRARIEHFNKKKYEAKKNGVEFTISFEEIEWPTHCPVLGMELDYIGNRNNSPSFDRVDPTKGYVSGNVQIISFRANAHKGDMSLDDVRRLYEYVINNTGASP